MPAHSHRIGAEYDPERARALLAEAGYPEGKGLPELEIIVPGWFQSAEGLVGQWEAIGARVCVRRAPGHVDCPEIGDSHLWLTGWTADYPDPDGFFRGLLLQEGPFHCDEDILELLEQGRSLQVQDERLRAYHEVDRLWVSEHAAILPLSYPRSMLLHRPWVQRLWTSPLSKAHLDEVVVGPRETAPSEIALPDEPEALERKERVDALDRL